MASARSRTVTYAPADAGCATCGTPRDPVEFFCHVCGAQTAPSVVSAHPITRRPTPKNRSRGRTPEGPLPRQPWAVISLVLGLLAYGPLPVIGAVGAVLSGHAARRAIRERSGVYRGQAMAVAGLALGYLQLMLASFLMFILFFVTSARAFIGLLH